MLGLASSFTALSTLRILATILTTSQITSPVLALSRDDIPSACRDVCDGSVSMLNSCGLESSGSNMNKDNSACFCQNMSKSNYKDCANCIRNNQDGYTDTTYYDTYTTTDYNNNDYNNNNDYDNDYNNDYNNDYDNNSNDYDGDYDDNNDYRKRAVPFGKPTPAPHKPRHLQAKRGILDDLLNLDGLVCTVDGVVSDVVSAVGDVTSLAISLVTEVIDGKTTTYTWGDRNRDYDPRPTTVYATVTQQRNSAVSKTQRNGLVVTLLFVITAFAL